jgi:proteic killer suppression protein
MIQSFKDDKTLLLLQGVRLAKVDLYLQRQARKRLLMLNAAESLDDLRVPPGNRLEVLSGERTGQYSILVNEQWRICFRWENGKANEVEFCDYHR